MPSRPQKNLGGEIALEELMESNRLHNLTIRYVCAVRKMLVLEDSNLPELDQHEVDLLEDINRLYHSFGRIKRQAAFEESNAPRPTVVHAGGQLGGYTRPEYEYKARANARPKQTVVAIKPAPVQPRYAKEFDTATAYKVAKEAIELMSKKLDKFEFPGLKKVAQAIHLAGGLEWHPNDLSRCVSNGQLRWVDRLQGALTKLRNEDVIAYRKSKGDYFIF